MLNNRKEHRKKRYTALASTAKIFSSPRRLELIDSLLQKPSSVEELAKATEQSVATASQHLQVLKRAHVVRTVRQGTTIIYHLLENIVPVFLSLREFAETEHPELRLLRQEAEEGIPMLSFSQTMSLLEQDAAILLDVRSSAEFENAHIEHAHNIPFKGLDAHLDRLSKDKIIIVVCRGPYCITSSECVDILRQRGFQAYRYNGGVSEWQHHGGQVITQ